MANLIKRENRDVTRRPSPEHRLDPFRMMDALLGRAHATHSEEARGPAEADRNRKGR